MADLTSNDYFTVNGVSSATVGLWIDTPPVPPMSRQRVTTWQTGVDMDFSSPDDVWEDITLTFAAYAFFKSAEFGMAAVYAFLANAQTLGLSRFANRFFKVRSLNQVTPAAEYDGQRIKLQIAFNCAPWKYHTGNTAVTPASGTVTNPGTRYSRPVYKIAHSGACALTVNGETLQIDATAASPIFIDAERMIAYDESGNNQTSHTTGQFPFLVPGTNAVSTTGTSVEITGNWRDY
jgi:phage-related protein